MYNYLLMEAARKEENKGADAPLQPLNVSLRS